MTNFTIVLDNTPGSLAAVCEAMGQAGVNIEGICCFASQGIAILYVAVQDAAGARQAVAKLGLRVSEERPVVAVPVADTPGGAGKMLRKIGDAGINIELAYQATGARLIVGTNHVERLRVLLA